MIFKEKITISLENTSLKEIFELLPVHIYWKDFDGIYVGCNKKQALDFGFLSSDEIIGKTDYDLLPEAEADLYRLNDQKVMRSGIPMTVEEHGYLSTKIPLRQDNGTVVGILGVSVDIKQYKKQIEKNTKMLDEIIASMPGHVYWKGKDGIFLGCNDQQAIDVGLKSRHDYAGKTDYDIINKNLPEHIRQKHAEAIMAADNEVMESGTPKTVEEFVIRLDGTEATYLSEKKPLFDNDGQIIGLLGISVDITEHKNFENRLKQANLLAEKANCLKTEFIENMQHDIRTPISGIFSLLDAAYKSGNLEDLKKYLPHLVNASRELLDIHNAVIDFENHEYGAKPIYNRKFSLLELLHSIIHINSAAALAHESSLALKVDDDVADVIKGDDYRLKKILLNLIGNAIKFTEKGRVILHVMLIHLKHKKTTIRFSIQDTGIGIPEEKIPTIFEKFTKLNPSNRGKFKGSGLGLHIVKKFVSEMDAELDVKSIINEGTIFTVDVVFELPLVQQLAGEDIHKEAERTLLIDATKMETETSHIVVSKEKTSDASTAPTNAVHICLIEDHEMAMMAAERILKNTNAAFHIEKAVNAAEALALLSQQKFDLVVCDLGLPDRPGFDIVEEIKRDKNHLNYQTPFVALTAHSDDARREQAKKVGFLGFYNKPLTEDMAKKIAADHLTHEATLIDIASMTDMFGGNEKTALDMIKILTSSFREDKVLFRDALNHNDYTRARELFHKFRGGISYIMAPELSKVAMLLHDDIKTFERENKPLSDLIPQLEILFKVVDDLEHWLSAYKASR